MKITSHYVFLQGGKVVGVEPIDFVLGQLERPVDIARRIQGERYPGTVLAVMVGGEDHTALRAQ